MFNCLSRGIFDCFHDPRIVDSELSRPIDTSKIGIKLDSAHMGAESVILKNANRLCGSGGVLGTAPIVQNKAYFEVTVQQIGTIGIGLANRSANLSSIPVNQNSWYLREDFSLWSNGEQVSRVEGYERLQEGDTIGVCFDHVDLKFYHNSNLVSSSISAVRGQVFPMLFVDDGAILDVKFKAFTVNPPPGYEEIMLEQTLL